MNKILFLIIANIVAFLLGYIPQRFSVTNKYNPVEIGLIGSAFVDCILVPMMVFGRRAITPIIIFVLLMILKRYADK